MKILFLLFAQSVLLMKGMDAKYAQLFHFDLEDTYLLFDGESCPITITPQIDGVSCYDICDGAIFLMPSGGIPPYTYTWDTGNWEEGLVNLCAGVYSVTVEDAEGCTAMLSIAIPEPEPLYAEAFVTDATCAGVCDGVVEIIVSGGMPPYSYTTIGDACPGIYQIFISDALGCIVQLNILIGVQEELVFETSIIHATNGESNGSISVIVTEGIAPFSYSINGGPFGTSFDFANLPDGYYFVCVRDANGCIECVEVEIQNITAIKDPVPHFNLYPNPVSTWLYVESSLPVAIDILDIHGHLIKQMHRSGLHQISMEDVLPGLYLLRIREANSITYRKLLVE